ncbi:28S ribosomal protein S29, mitochondrial [Microplitis mediator]|uniref:28S ribosomal protein S29, mitochondrial n=1 Tax=Microplitis mediator TaxID=375433 RepID=UPI0025572891|nr:28S ribosomal protein S29, mitochondrial [Microplitis mediator]
MIPTRLLRRVSNNVRNQSTVTERIQVQPEEPIQTFRTIESDPAKHNRDHLNRFYTVPVNVKNRIFPFTGVPRRFNDHCKTFAETCILVREPAIELISYLQQTDYTRPVNRYVIYGPLGSGKTLTLMHLMHYGFNMKHLIVHVPWIPDWFRRRSESAPSERVEGLFNLPIVGAFWLAHFKHQNGPLLAQLDIRLQKDYIWNPREQNPAGTPLVDMIDFGIARGKYACDVIDGVLNEIKLSSTAGICKTLVLLDGFNALFAEDSIIKDSEFKRLYANRVSLTHSFLNFTKYDWCNGAIVALVDILAVKKENQFESSMYPRYLLGKEGFEHLDPFLPIEVPFYTQDEFDAVIEYYKNRLWLRNLTESGKRELEILTQRSPYKLMRYTAPL